MQRGMQLLTQLHAQLHAARVHPQVLVAGRTIASPRSIERMHACAGCTAQRRKAPATSTLRTPAPPAALPCMEGPGRALMSVRVARRRQCRARHVHARGAYHTHPAAALELCSHGSAGAGGPGPATHDSIVYPWAGRARDLGSENAWPSMAMPTPWIHVSFRIQGLGY